MHIIITYFDGVQVQTDRHENAVFQPTPVGVGIFDARVEPPKIKKVYQNYITMDFEHSPIVVVPPGARVKES